jgi:mono/diheme cytochrome c family protein
LGAAQQPGSIERALAPRIIARWIAHGAPAAANPIPPTPENLEFGRDEYNEHCAACHGLDGSGRNRFEGDFLAQIPRLTGDVQELSDAELYFVIFNGIRNTAMPGFGARHNTEEIWRTILWVRHLAQLKPEERKEIAHEIVGSRARARGDYETRQSGRWLSLIGKLAMSSEERFSNSASNGTSSNTSIAVS